MCMLPITFGNYCCTIIHYQKPSYLLFSYYSLHQRISSINVNHCQTQCQEESLTKSTKNSDKQLLRLSCCPILQISYFRPNNLSSPERKDLSLQIAATVFYPSQPSLSKKGSTRNKIGSHGAQQAEENTSQMSDTPLVAYSTTLSISPHCSTNACTVEALSPHHMRKGSSEVEADRTTEVYHFAL